jgi:ABC-2 type transport system ATP-binding protein
VRILIKIENLIKTYKTFSGKKTKPVVKNFSLTISKGESFGFLGPNGAGKSTVIKTLMNFIRSDSGSLTINGTDVNNPNARLDIGYLPEQPLFYDHLSAEEILRFGGRIAGMDQHTLEPRIDMLLERLLLSHARSKPIRTYSKGMNQLTGLALAMIHDPSICILDEPMSGLDPMGRKLVTDFILDMRKAGKTIFFSSHILSDVEKLCDRVGILNKGKLLYCGSIDELIQQTGNIEQSFVNLIDGDNKVNA